MAYNGWAKVTGAASKTSLCRESRQGWRHLSRIKEHCFLLRCPTPSLELDEPEYQPNQQPWCEAKWSICIMPLLRANTLESKGNTWALGQTFRIQMSTSFHGTNVNHLVEQMWHWFKRCQRHIWIKMARLLQPTGGWHFLATTSFKFINNDV